MPASNKNINSQRRLNERRSQRFTGSTLIESRSKAQRRASRTDELDTTPISDPSRNRFAALSPTQPAPDAVNERESQQLQSDFTYRSTKRPVGERYLESQSGSEKSSTSEEEICMPPRRPRVRRAIQSSPVITSSLAADPKGSTLSQDGMATTHESGAASSIFPRGTVQSPLNLTVDASSKTQDGSSVKTVLSQMPDVIHPSLPSPTSMTTESPLRNWHEVSYSIPRVFVPPTPAYAPDATFSQSYFSVPSPLYHVSHVAEERVFSIAVEIAAANVTSVPQLRQEKPGMAWQSIGRRPNARNTLTECSRDGAGDDRSDSGEDLMHDDFGQTATDGDWEWID